MTSQSSPAPLIWRGITFPLPVPAHRRRLFMPSAGAPRRYATEPLLLVNVDDPAVTAARLTDHRWHRLVRGQLSGGRQMDKATEAAVDVAPGRVTVTAFEDGPVIEADLAPDLERAVVKNKRLLVIVAARPTLEDLRRIPKRPDAFVEAVEEAVLGSGAGYTVAAR
ncbi:hypothetical protein [Acidipropionibacterium virtanenii]|uniref:Uncharacterized protein n=1 Tax=Acidipropionibacterium virtanenii TaxID=2057246 RepID=A0A344UT79_9ACTN|nr:hypothetical protein [Acidipropionibacterium virtanenii]AXE38477.1 hypothetical protein JS278_01301 [Acidipropionibacterium virtanenii]